MHSEESCRQLAIKMQQNFKDPEDANNCRNSHLEDFVAVASAINAVEKVLKLNCSDTETEIARAREIINSHFPVLPSKSIMLENLSENAPIILAKLENKAGYSLNDEQKKQALGLIRSLQLSSLATVKDVIHKMSEMPSLKHFVQLLNASSDQ